MIRCVVCSQVSSQNQDSLGVKRPAQFYLPLYVDHVSLTEANSRSQATGPPERKVAEHQHRQSVHLTGLGACDIDHDRSHCDLLVYSLADPVCAVDLCVDRLLDVLCLYHFHSVYACPVVSFAQQVVDHSYASRQSLLIASHSRAVLQEARHCAAVESSEAVFTRERRQQLDVALHILRGRIHQFCKVGRHLEELLKVGIMLAEEIVEHRLTQQNNLNVQRERLGLERHHVHHTQGLTKRFNPQVTGLECAFECFPCVRCAQQLVGVQHDVAAVGTV